MSCRLVSRLCIQKVNSPKLPRAVWFCNPGVQFHHLLNLQRGSMPFREESLSQTRIGAGVLSAQSLLMIFKMSPGTSHRRGFMDCPLERGLLIANQPCEEMATSTPPHHKIKGCCLKDGSATQVENDTVQSHLQGALFRKCTVGGWSHLQLSLTPVVTKTTFMSFCALKTYAEKAAHAAQLFLISDH